MPGRGLLGVAVREHVHLVRVVQESQDPTRSQELHTGLAPRPVDFNLHPAGTRSGDSVFDLHPDEPILVTNTTRYIPPPAPPRPSQAEGVTSTQNMGSVGSKLRAGVVIAIATQNTIPQQ